MVFATTNTSVLALDRDTGKTLWATEISMNGTWPVAYKIDGAHMIVEGTCLDPQTGQILWTAPHSARTQAISTQTSTARRKKCSTSKAFHTLRLGLLNPSNPPTLAWKTYVPGGGRVGSGVTYGEGKVFPGSFKDVQMAIDAKTGKVLWSTPTKSPMIFSGSYYQGRFLRGGTDDNTMYCFNATNGETLWTYNANTVGYFTIGTAVAYGMVYEPIKTGTSTP